MHILCYTVQSKAIHRIEVPDTVSNFETLYTGQPIGVYTVLRTFHHNRFIGLQNHLDRMMSSMRLLGWNESLDMDEIRYALAKAVSSTPWNESRVRIDVAKDEITFGEHSGKVFIALHELIPPTDIQLNRGVFVEISQELSRQMPLAKTSDFPLKRKALMAKAKTVYEYLILGPCNQILEGSSSNFYGVLNGVVHTAGENVLEGVTRSVLLCLLRDMNVPVDFEPIKVQDLSRLSETFISSSARGIVPVVRVGEVVIDGVSHQVQDGSAVVVPAGAKHNVINTSEDVPLKLYTIYSPPEHLDGTVHKTKADVLEEHFDGKTTE